MNLSYDNFSIDKSEKFRIYKNAVILTEGEWSDSITMSPIVYTKAELEKGATNWKSNFLNIDHSFSVDDRIGYVMHPHYDNGAVKGDLHIHRDLQKGKDTIERIDCGLVNSISAELTTNDRYDSDSRKYLACDLTFLGSAVCLFPAADGTRIIQ